MISNILGVMTMIIIVMGVVIYGLKTEFDVLESKLELCQEQIYKGDE